MEIHNSGNDPRIQYPADKPTRKPGEAKGESSVQSTDPVRSSRLAERLEGDAEVRARLLVEVKAKFLAGEYQTRAAAEEAARQIVE